MWRQPNLLQQGAEEQWGTASNHAGCLRGSASSGDGNEIGAQHATRRVGVRSNKHLNTIIEQDHRRIKHRIGPMLGLKRFDTAAITICGIELAAKISKQQCEIGKLPGGVNSLCKWHSVGGRYPAKLIAPQPRIGAPRRRDPSADSGAGIRRARAQFVACRASNPGDNALNPGA